MFNFYHDIDEFLSDYGLDTRLIPQSHKNDCPMTSKYRARFGVCSCNSHCSWDLCRMIIPPTDCLLRIRSTWNWDQNKSAWVAQTIKGTNYELNY